MRHDTYISSLDDLEDWFTLNQSTKEPKPYFTLWRGTEPAQNRLIFRNEEVSEPDKSFELLSDIIASHSQGGGGTFRIYLTSKPGHNIGVHTLLRIAAPGGVGIQGVGAPVNYGIYGSAAEMIEEEVKRRVEVIELRKELEEIRAGQAAVSGIAQFKELLEYPAFQNLVQMFGMKIMGLGPQPNNPRPQPAPVPNAATDSIAGDLPEYDYDIVDPALDKLNQAFPGDAENALQKIADWAASNPEQAKVILAQINTQ